MSVVRTRNDARGVANRKARARLHSRVLLLAPSVRFHEQLQAPRATGLNREETVYALATELDGRAFRLFCNAIV